MSIAATALASSTLAGGEGLAVGTVDTAVAVVAFRGGGAGVAVDAGALDTEKGATVAAGFVEPKAAPRLPLGRNPATSVNIASRIPERCSRGEGCKVIVLVQSIRTLSDIAAPTSFCIVLVSIHEL